MLNENDEHIGSTLHTMEERLDAGEIVWQKALPMPPNPSQYKIAYLTKALLATGILEVLSRIHNDSLNPIQPKYDSSYHRAPTEAEGREFHRQGKRVLRVSDLKLMLKSHF